MTTKKALRKKPSPEKHLPEKSPPPQWVQEMHNYFRENGFYRTEDLQRVLGDPRESVTVKSSVDLMQMSKQLSQ